MKYENWGQFSIWTIEIYLNILGLPRQWGRNSRWKNQFTENTIENLHKAGKESNFYSTVKYMKDAHILSIFQWNANNNNVTFFHSYNYPHV